MPAELIPSPGEGQPHLLKLPRWQNAGDLAAEVGDALLLGPHLTGSVTLLGSDWPLRMGDYQALMALLAPLSLSLERVCSLEAGARVAAAALGLEVSGRPPQTDGPPDGGQWSSLSLPFSIHEGTLRSGEHRHASGSLLVLGDVNPGAHIQAETIKSNGGTTLEVEQPAGRLQTLDLRLHKGHLGQGAKAAKINATGFGPNETRDHAGHQA
jgi:septum site-determining protein MinC